MSMVGELPGDPGTQPTGPKYDYDLELRSDNNSHVQLLARVPDGARVLELGCATGYMSAYLGDKKACKVVGVDIDPAAVAKAAEHCEKALCLDVEAVTWGDELGDDRFDVILCADIIEHLKDPERFLASLRSLFRAGGRLLASVPNGAHVSIRLELLQGQLTYEDTGLLDRTHLHLFTHQSLMALLVRAGYAVEVLSYTFHDIPDKVLAEKLRQAGLEPTEKALARLHAPEAVAYQFIVEARPLADGEADRPYPELDDKPLRDSAEVYRVVHEQLHQTQLVAENRQKLIEAKERHFAEVTRVLNQQLDANNHQLEANKHQLEAKEKHLVELIHLNNRHSYQLAHNEGRIAELLAQRANYEAVLRQLRNDYKVLEAVLSTPTWRAFRVLTLPVRAVVRLLPYAAYAVRHPSVVPQWLAKAVRLWRQGGLQAVRKHLTSTAATPRPVTDYALWIEQCEARMEPNRSEVQAFVAGLDDPPHFSIIMPVYEPRPEWLRAAIESVIAQTYPYWQLCIADDASPSAEIGEILNGYQARNARIKVRIRETNGHISAATTTALELSEHEWAGFMDHDDLLSPNALYHVARALLAHPEAQVLYSDEDKIDDQGVRSAHYFKPDYNPDLMLSHNLVCHFSVYRRALIDQVGGLREGLEGAQDYDLALRCIAAVDASQVHHIPRVLYHWRAVAGSTASGLEAKPYALDAAVRAVSEDLQSRGIQAVVTPSDLIHGMLRVRYPVPEPAPLVSLIIPTRNGVDLLRQCIDSVRSKTDYSSYEVVVIDNQSDDPAALEYLGELQATGQARVIRYDRPFNYAAINNYAVTQASGGFLCFLNNDIEVISAGWLTEMVSQAARPDIGAVGARLLYPDGRLQHGGVVTGLGGVAGHAMKYLARESKGYNGRAVLVQNYSAVTTACMVVRREVFDEVGGFDAEHLGVAFNDVDLCLRIREQGYRNLWTPYAELYHHESATRGPEDTAEKQARFSNEITYMKSRWGVGLLRDPAYNPNLTLDREDFSLSRHCPPDRL